MLFITLSEIEKNIPGEWLFLPDHFSPITTVHDNSQWVTPHSLFVAIGKGHQAIPEAIQNGATALCIDQPLSPELIQQIQSKQLACRRCSNSLTAFHDLAKLWRSKLQRLPIIGLTGSCGKTTTKEILATILEQHFPGQVLKTKGNWNNHFGLPRMLLSLTENHQVGVLEMGSNHPGEIECLTQIARPNIALITNVGHAHLEFFHTTEGVAREKSSIYHGLPTSKGTAIFNYDTPHLDILRQEAAPYCLRTFGLNQPLADVNVIYHGTSDHQAKIEMIWRSPSYREVFTWSYIGEHQALNAAAAAVAATALGISPQEICQAIRQVPSIEMRMETYQISGISWINDAYNANPDSMKAGLQVLHETYPSKDQSLIIALGDMLELGDSCQKAHHQVLEFAKNLFPKAHLFAIGEHFMAQSSHFPQVSFFAHTQDAQSQLTSYLQPGSVVYLKGSRIMGLEQLIPGIKNSNH